MAGFPTEIAVLPFRIGVAPSGTESILSAYRGLLACRRRIARRDPIVSVRKRTAAVPDEETPTLFGRPASERCRLLSEVEALRAHCGEPPRGRGKAPDGIAPVPEPYHEDAVSLAR